MKTTCASFKQREYRDIVSVLTREGEQCDAAECEDVAAAATHQVETWETL